MLETTAQICRRLDHGEIAELMESMTGRDCTLSDGEYIRKMLPASLDQPIALSLPAFTDALWQRVLRPIVKERLVILIENRQVASEKNNP